MRILFITLLFSLQGDSKFLKAHDAARFITCKHASEGLDAVYERLTHAACIYGFEKGILFYQQYK